MLFPFPGEDPYIEKSEFTIRRIDLAVDYTQQPMPVFKVEDTVWGNIGLKLQGLR
ncbi:MAG TPA: hypothetical protein VIQ31_22120 [Phormidium sp.]